MCEHNRITHEIYLRDVCADCGLPIPVNTRSMKFCGHPHAILVRVYPDPDGQGGVINPDQARFILYCPDCGNFIDYIQHDADSSSDDDIPF